MQRLQLSDKGCHNECAAATKLRHFLSQIRSSKAFITEGYLVAILTCLRAQEDHNSNWHMKKKLQKKSRKKKEEKTKKKLRVGGVEMGGDSHFPLVFVHASSAYSVSQKKASTSSSYTCWG